MKVCAMVQKKSTTKKGGRRNYKKGRVEVSTCVEILEAHRVRHGSVHCFDFKSYHLKPSTNAIAAVDLLMMKPLLMDFLRVAPRADLTYKPLHMAFQNVLQKDKGIYDIFVQKQEGQQHMKSLLDIASDLANSMVCALSHCRRLKNVVRWQQATSKLNSALVADLEALRDAVKIPDGFNGSEGAEEVEEEMPPTQELLQHYESEVAMAQSSESHTSEEDSLLKEALQTSPVPTKKKAIESIVEAHKRPATLPIVNPKKRPASSVTTSSCTPDIFQEITGNKKAASGPKAAPCHCVSFGRLYTTYATKQSYVCVKKEGKKVLLVSVSQTMSADHANVLKKLVEWLQSCPVGLTKAEVIAKRDALVHHDA